MNKDVSDDLAKVHGDVRALFNQYGEEIDKVLKEYGGFGNVPPNFSDFWQVQNKLYTLNESLKSGEVKLESVQDKDKDKDKDKEKHPKHTEHQK
jgi:Skp family chaperone for outer membrane proteins